MPVRIYKFRETLLILGLLAGGQLVFAVETDQFTVPPSPLCDIGPVLSRKVVEIIESDRTGNDPERVLSRWIGRNIFESRLALWVKEIRVPECRISFRPNVFESIYRETISPVPASFWFDSPTVYLHGYYMGTDKIDHFFRQGYEYFDRVMKRESKGVVTAEAIAAAVALGVKQEHEYYGTLATGIFSNGDLAANYAGMKFYMNLRKSVQIGQRVLPPLFERSLQGWRLRQKLNPDLVLQPFLSNHLDESLNPSRYRFSRGSIRSLIRERCDTWSRFYVDRLSAVALSGQSFAADWFGEEYGHWLPPSDEISIATECDARLKEAVKAK